MRGSSHRRNRAIICAVALLLALKPLADADLWWNIARGHAVLDGNLQPSHALLLNHGTADSDWLRGAVCSLVYEFTGTSGLMLLKLGVALLITTLLCRFCVDRSWFLPSAIGLMLAISPAIDPSPATTDVLLILTQRIYWLARG